MSTNCFVCCKIHVQTYGAPHDLWFCLSLSFSPSLSLSILLSVPVPSHRWGHNAEPPFPSGNPAEVWLRHWQSQRSHMACVYVANMLWLVIVQKGLGRKHLLSISAAVPPPASRHIRMYMYARHMRKHTPSLTIGRRCKATKWHELGLNASCGWRVIT